MFHGLDDNIVDVYWLRKVCGNILRVIRWTSHVSLHPLPSSWRTRQARQTRRIVAWKGGAFHHDQDLKNGVGKWQAWGECNVYVRELYHYWKSTRNLPLRYVDVDEPALSCSTYAWWRCLAQIRTPCYALLNAGMGKSHEYHIWIAGHVESMIPKSNTGTLLIKRNFDAMKAHKQRESFIPAGKVHFTCYMWKGVKYIIRWIEIVDKLILH